MSCFEDIKVGDSAELVHVITSEDVEKFVALTGDDNKIHIDIEYASHTTFKKPVVHGMLGASFISTLIGTRLPGDGALWFSQSLEFILPVRVGDSITIRAEVKRKFDRENIIELQTDIFNQNHQKVTAGTAKVKIIEQVRSEISSSEHLSRRKIAFVVGATGGIGRAVSVQLAEDGYDVALHYFKNKRGARELEQQIISLGRKCHLCCSDITDEDQLKVSVEDIVRKFGTITVLVNCTTVKVINSNFMLLDWKVVQSHFDLNVKGAFLLAKLILPIMQNQKYGKIIHFSTQYIETTPPSELLAYVVAKSALHGFSKSLAVENAFHGITINMISPGMTDTELIADIPEKTRLMTAAKTPLRRLAKPEDIAGAVSFLASSRADYITGETIRVNGGQVML